MLRCLHRDDLPTPLHFYAFGTPAAQHPKKIPARIHSGHLRFFLAMNCLHLSLSLLESSFQHFVTFFLALGNLIRRESGKRRGSRRCERSYTSEARPAFMPEPEHSGGGASSSIPTSFFSISSQHIRSKFIHLRVDGLSKGSPSLQPRAGIARQWIHIRALCT